MRKSGTPAAVTFLALTLAFTGCGDEDDSTATDDTSAPANTADTAASDGTAAPDDTSSPTSISDTTGSPDTTGTSDTTGSGDADEACLVLTAEEVSAATSLDTTLTSEPRGPDLICSYTDAAGALVGELQVTTAPNVETVLAGAQAGTGTNAGLVYVEGVGEGLAVSDTGLQGYLLVGEQGYVWTSIEASLSQTQLEDLMRSIVAG